MTQLRLTVADRVDVADGVARFELREVDGTDLPAWLPGAHIEVGLGGGLTRQYSLCGDPRDRSTWRIAVLREPGGRGGSLALHDGVVPGDTLVASEPRNHFALEPAGRYLFIAGGIGITPIVPMLARAEAVGAEWTLVYGGRSRSSMAFHEELVVLYGDRVLVRPQDEFGLLDLDQHLADAGEGEGEGLGALVYCCGPAALLDAVALRCASSPGRLRLERFQPEEQQPSVASAPFTVGLAISRLELEVPPDRSILEVAEEAGAPVLYSCQEGVCGSCETRVLEGVPDHRDSVLSDADRDAGETMMICVSRATSERIVLEL